MTRIGILILGFFLPLYLFAQISTNPAIPIDSKAITITFDSSKDSRLGYFTSDLYAHTGVSITGIGDWGSM